MHRRGEILPQPRHQGPGLTGRGPVHRTEDGDLRLLPGGHDTGVDEPGVEVASETGLGHRPVTGHCGERAGFELSDIGGDEPPPFVGAESRPQLPRNLQGSSPAGGPPPRDDSTGHINGPVAALIDPLVEPVPAVGRQQTRHLLVLEEGFDRGMLARPQLPFRGRSDVDSRIPQGRKQPVRRIEVDPRIVEGGPHLLGLGQHFRRLPVADRPGSEQFGQYPVVFGFVPGHSGRAHLCGDESSCRFRGQQQPQPSGIARGLDRGCLPGIFGQGRLEIVRNLGDETAPGIDVEESGRLFGCGGIGGRGVPIGGSAQRLGRGDEFGAGEYCVCQPQIVAALDAHSGSQ